VPDAAICGSDAVLPGIGWALNEEYINNRDDVRAESVKLSIADVCWISWNVSFVPPLPDDGPCLGHGNWDRFGATRGRDMKLLRRKFLKLAGGVVAASAFPQPASADDYPTRPVRIIAGFAAGGGVDITARLIGQWLADRLGQSFVIENRAGAGGNIGTEAVVNAAPDGYTLLLATVPNAVNASLYEKLNFDFIRGIAPVAGIIRVPMVILLHPSVPARTVPEFILYAKANPGKINMASAGNGSAPHMAGELFKMMAGVNMVHVPYRGQGPALTDLLGGQVQVLFATAPGTTDYISTGKLRALAVTSASRAEMLPELPTVGDFVPGYETSQWYGIGAPANTSAEIVDRLNKEINAAITDPGMKARFAAIGGEPLPGSPAEFGKLISEETEKWGKVVRAAGIKPE
jgi:tripartite-type tricarboxylate transporter receptor subunit TctC